MDREVDLESVFLCMKRMYGEHVSARKFPNMINEIFLKAAEYFILRNLSQAIFYLRLNHLLFPYKLSLLFYGYLTLLYVICQLMPLSIT